MQKTYTSVSIVIPVYNEKRTLPRLLDRVLAAPTLGLAKQVVVVDDGSTDGTRDILKKYRAKNLTKIYLPENHGKGYALRTGFAEATGTIVVVQDADLEYNPADYPVLLAPFVAGASRVVYGSRELHMNMHSYPLYFLGGELVTYTTRLLFGGRLTDVPTGYKAFDRTLLTKLPLRCTRFEFCPEVTALLLKRKEMIVEVPIRYAPRKLEDGKKIRWWDGVEALFTLLRVRVGL